MKIYNFMLQAHTIKAAHGAKHRVKRVGRGNASGHGTSSTRGGKGQTARSGGSRGLARLAFKRLLQSTPKLRGFNSLQTKPSEIYLHQLDKYFDNDAVIDLQALVSKGLVGSNIKKVKIVGTGKITKKVTIAAGIPCTKGAAEQIKAAGGIIST